MDYRNALDVTGSVAVITGGARGIGFDVGGGARVMRGKDRAGRARSERAGRGRRPSRRDRHRLGARCARRDDPAAVAKAADAIVTEQGKVDILVNSAGIARLNSAVETPDEEWRAVMDVNINGVFWCCRAFGRHMIARRSGSIVNLGSMSGLIANRPQTAASYLASKGAVHMLTRERLATEWAKSGVRVNALAPGYVATEMTLRMRERSELFNVWLDMTPMGRIGKPSEVAAAVVYLASAASSYVTGAVLSIDGGYTAW